MRVLILGASGMLGNTALRLFAGSRDCDTWGTARATTVRQYLAPGVQERVVCGVDIGDSDDLTRVLLQVRPDVVINCVGLSSSIPWPTIMQPRSESTRCCRTASPSYANWRCEIDTHKHGLRLRWHPGQLS
jgi:nucleoside-diphosphate-sugar epimerase